MSRKQMIYDALYGLCQKVNLENFKQGFSGFDAAQISKICGIIRNNVSKDLNQLTREKKILKVKGHPVYFFDRKRLEYLLGNITIEKTEVESIQEMIHSRPNFSQIDLDIFHQIIGANMSLDLAIKQAKAAIFYPPHGLHSILIGPTGSGKTTFAEIMYQYALQSKTLKEDAQFVIFNCAEYADNPQLILSQLFGHVKGAFTSAVKDNPGLIEKADGGILLLDEVHRLPPEGQEMLFTLMDKHKYRRVGETNTTRSADVLFIAATTEDVESVLLKTFLRRIPMVIKLPSLPERTLEERYELISKFFSVQSEIIQAKIRVYREVMKALLLYECKGNIGQLKSDIQLICARGFLEYKTHGKARIEIDTPLLPEHVYNGLLHNQKKRNRIFEIMGSDHQTYYDFPQDNFNRTYLNDNDLGSDKVYFELTETYQLYSNRGYSQEKINRKMNKVVEKYLQKLLHKLDANESNHENEKLFKFISPRVYDAVQSALKIAADMLKKPIQKKVIIALAMHIDALSKRKTENNTYPMERLRKIAVTNPTEYAAAKAVRSALESLLQISIPEIEEAFITMFLTTVNLEHRERHIGVLIVTHGRSTASSIAEVCNNLLGTNHCKAIDMALDEKIETIFEKTMDYVKSIDEGHGVLLLVDMGSLAAFDKIITERTGIRVETIDMVSTPLALDAVRKSLIPGMTLPQLTADLYELIGSKRTTTTVPIPTEFSGIYAKTIVTVCMTSKGTAVKLAELIQTSIPNMIQRNITVQPMTIDKIQTLSNEKLETIFLFVGSLNPRIPSIPYISTDEIVIDHGLERIRTMIEGKYISSEQKAIPNLTMDIIEETLDFLNPQKAYPLLETALQEIVALAGIEKNNHLKTAFFMHCTCMIERSIRKEYLPYKGADTHIAHHQELYHHLRKVFKTIEENFGTIISDTEICYVIDMLDTEERTINKIV
ncbi:sigma 54-interacting transcriptional regulator [Anaerosinus massiliensis]|uniref:sigma 54-interacting transcriptional regulator n=1 Tax=Massilibacillus massiliensis TaxID=1806837 RepID=UPI000A8666A5|nr:sigma-54-dependent transcriptional regulator [Massilibacillus massiliensis]